MLVALFVVSLLMQVPGYPNGCARCGVFSYVDVPSVETTVSQGAIYLAGWGFECESGSPADRVDVFYQGDDGWYVPAGGAGNHGNGDLYFGVPRPDVQAAYTGSCPNVTTQSGWHFYFTQPVPLGTRQLAINVWRGPYFQTHYRTVTVLP